MAISENETFWLFASLRCRNFKTSRPILIIFEMFFMINQCYVLCYNNVKIAESIHVTHFESRVTYIMISRQCSALERAWRRHRELRASHCRGCYTPGWIYLQREAITQPRYHISDTPTRNESHGYSFIFLGYSTAIFPEVVPCIDFGFSKESVSPVFSTSEKYICYTHKTVQ